MKKIFKQALLTSSLCFLACACDVAKPGDQKQDSSDQDQPCKEQNQSHKQNQTPSQTVIESRGTAAPGQETQVQKPASEQAAPVAGPSSEEKGNAPAQKTEEVVQPTLKPAEPAPIAPMVQESKPAESAPIAQPALEKQEESPTPDKVTLEETPAGSPSAAKLDLK